MRGAVRQVEWVGDEDPERLEAATITLAADRLDAFGTSRATDYVASWSLETGEDWVTSRLHATVFGRGFTRRLTLVRDAHGRWTSDAAHEGSRLYRGEELDDPGLSDADLAAGAFDGAFDCDIAFCPVTNTMPILRLGAQRQAVTETPFVMAWVGLPSLAVIRSEQFYSAGPYDPEAGHAVVRYVSGTRDFVADLTVDQDGVVIDYPQLARRIRTRG